MTQATQPALEPPRRILVINVSRIGDTMLATPAIRALAQARPHARIDFFGHPRRFDLLRHLPFVARCAAISKHRERITAGWPNAHFDGLARFAAWFRSYYGHA